MGQDRLGEPVNSSHRPASQSTPQDSVYVTEIGNDRVQVFDKDGKFLTSLGSKGAGNGEFGNLHGIVIDKATGWIYVADTANNRIQVFKPAKASNT